MSNTRQDPPIDWPAVSIGGVCYPLEWDFRVMYRAGKQGLDFAGLGRSVTSFSTHLDLLSILTSPIFEKKGERPPTGEEWADRLESMDQFQVIARAINQSYLMSRKLQPAADPPTPQETAKPGGLPN